MNSNVSMSSLVRQTPEQLSALAAELERVARTKKDYIVPASKLAMWPSEDGPRMSINGLNTQEFPTVYGLRKIAHEQLSDKLGIPLPYYRRMMAEKPHLLADNVNAWMADSGKNHLVRILDGDIRAVLGDTYRVLDNFDAFYKTVPVIRQAGATILAANVTEEKLYIRAIHPAFQERIAAQMGLLGGPGGHRTDWDGEGGTGAPDMVCPGVLVRNSEVGRGGFTVSPYVFRFTCSNGAFLDNELFQVHSGKRNGEGEYMSQGTRQLEDEVFWAKVGDLVAATFDREKWATMVATMNGMAAQVLEEPIEAVDNVVKAYGLSDDDRAAILKELISPTTDIDPGRTVWGLQNAITSLGNKTEQAGDVDQAFVYQRIGGDILQQAPKVRELVRVRR